MMLLFDTLLTLDERLNLVGRLATSWRQVSETEWEFILRDDVAFSNGEPCNATAVVHSIHHLATMVPTYSFRSQWGEAWPPSARAVDETTVVISTPSAQVTLPYLLSRIEIIPPRASQDPGFANYPVGSGPYRLKSWTRGGSLLLRANKGYYAGSPGIEELEWVAIRNPAARVVALRAGDVDLVWDVPYERIGIIEADPRLKALEYQSIGLAFVSFNFRRKSSPIANPIVRAAMTYAIDARGIFKTLLDGRGRLSEGPAPHQVIGAVDAGGYPERDLPRARRMLKEAGYADGMDLVLIYEAGNFQHEEDVCGALIAQLGDVGIRVRFDELPPGGMFQRVKKTDWDLVPNSVPGSFTAQASYHYYQLKAQLGFQSVAVERLLDEANSITTARRVELLQQSMRLLWQDIPYLFSFEVARTFGAVRELQDVDYIPVNWLNLTHARV